MVIECQRCHTKKIDRLMRHHKGQLLCPFCHVEVLHAEDTQESRANDTAVFLVIIAVIIVSISVVSGLYWGFNRV